MLQIQGQSGLRHETFSNKMPALSGSGNLGKARRKRCKGHPPGPGTATAAAKCPEVSQGSAEAPVRSWGPQAQVWVGAEAMSFYLVPQGRERMSSSWAFHGALPNIEVPSDQA